MGRHIYNYILLLSSPSVYSECCFNWIIRNFSVEKACGILLICLRTGNKRRAKAVT